MKSLPEVRRILTAIDAQGQSYIAEDGPSSATLTNPGRPGYRNANLWRTVDGPTAMHAPDSTLQHQGVMPPAGGTVMRVIDFPPRPSDPEEQRRQHEAVFKSMYSDARHQPDSKRHPGMHETDSVDYAIVLSGEIVAIMDKDETVMHAGDILVQRGTNHAWENRTDEIARLVFVLIDARGTRMPSGG
jgi:mannose-6-phosphate isomerase-like protein (cupin superfamily)